MACTGLTVIWMEWPVRGLAWLGRGLAWTGRGLPWSRIVGVWCGLAVVWLGCDLTCSRSGLNVVCQGRGLARLCSVMSVNWPGRDLSLAVNRTYRDPAWP
jgi:hypothetical protein